MGLILAIDIIVVAALLGVALTKGFEQALPLFAFIVVLAPGESTIPLPGLFILTTQRVAIITLVALYCAVGGKSVKAWKQGSTPLGYLLLLILGWNLISTMNSIVFTTSLNTVLSNIFDFYLLYYIFTKTVSDVRTIHKILFAFVSALTICCIFGWVEAYFNWSVASLFPTVSHRFTPGQDGLMEAGDRIRSTFPHPILFANGLALGIPMALYLLTVARSTLRRTFLCASILLMFWNIFKTMSRGPWLALMLSFVLLTFLSERKIRKYQLIISALTILVLVIRPGVWETLKNTYFETTDADSARGESYQYRYTLMRIGREALAKDAGRAAWGFGPEAFYYLGLTGEDPDTGHIVKFDSCDSALVELMVDTGYVGLLLVIILLFKAASVAWKGFTNLPKTGSSLCGLLFINIVAYSFMMVSVMNFGWGQQSHMLWILVALSMISVRILRREASLKQVERLRSILPGGWDASYSTDFAGNGQAVEAHVDEIQ